MAKPNFIIAGVARSGTTSLYYYLKQHPEISMPEKKEPKYFSSISLNFPHNGPGDYFVDKECIKTFDEYMQIYKPLNNRRIGDASSDYFYYAEYTAENIYKVLGDIPIIIILRDPIQRSFSAYNNLIRDGRENLSFKDSLVEEEKRLENNYDWMWAYKKGGLYCEKLKIFKKQFSRVHVIVYDDFKKDPISQCKKIFNFLDINSDFVPDTNTNYSHSGKIKNPIIRLLSDRNNKISIKIRYFILKMIPRKYIEFLLSKNIHKSEVEEDTKIFLKNYFQKDKECLEILLDKKLSNWL